MNLQDEREIAELDAPSIMFCSLAPIATCTSNLARRIVFNRPHYTSEDKVMISSRMMICSSNDNCVYARSFELSRKSKQKKDNK
ncbi:MAG: hypothetical protein ACTSQE_17200 [Candidatus Heimdallarchaeaceae archaeon]